MKRTAQSESMPASAIGNNSVGPHKILTTIYRQSWPPPADTTRNESAKGSRGKKASVGRSWNGENRARFNTNKITRPFSASLISPRTEKNGARLMSARRASSTRLSDVRGLDTATFQKKTKPSSKIPEYDSRKVISDSASAKNRAVAAEYIAMLSGRNFVKKQYRDQFWQNDANLHRRPPTGRYIGKRREPKLYPDLGSVIGGRAPDLSGSPILPNSPPRPTGPWRLSTSSITTQASSSRDLTVPCLNNGATSDGSQTVPDLGITFRSKRSWSNVPSGKCYRVLSHPNDTLASLCLEGRPTGSRGSDSRTSSLSSTISFSRVVDSRYQLSSGGESTPSGSSDAISGQSRSASGDEDQMKNVEFSGIGQKTEKYMKVERDRSDDLSGLHGLPDSVFEDDHTRDSLQSEDDSADDDREEQNDEQDEKEEDYVENLAIDSVGRLSFSDLEESDISENEAEDYEEEEDIDEDEVNRRLQQVSAVFDTANDVHSTRPPADTAISKVKCTGDASDFDDDSFSFDECQTPDEMTENNFEFTDFLPRPYGECDLRLFATLPSAMDWRAFVQRAPQKRETALMGTQRKSAKNERRAKERDEKRRKSLEETIDRLIMLEKMQALTVQYEQDKRRHLIHRAKARNSQRASLSNGQQGSTQATTSTTNGETRPQSARAPRRRSSTVSACPAALSKSRKPSSSNEFRSDAALNKSSPDLDFVRLSCTKNHLQYATRLSFTHRRRSRFGASLPRYYEYSWSERVPPSKRQGLGSLLYMKPRNCQLCRESEKKLAHLHTMQMMLGRPRSSFRMLVSEQQKLHPRPSTSNPIMKSTNDASSKENRIADQPIPGDNHKPHKSPTPNSTATSPPKTTSRAAHDKISAAKAMLSSVARDYAKAAKPASVHSRRSSAPAMTATRSGRSSACSGLRYRKDAQVLKPSVIDCANLRLR